MADVEAFLNGAARHLQAATDAPDEAKQTLPFAVRLGRDHGLSVGFYRGEAGLVRDRPRRIWFPFAQVTWNAATGAYAHQAIDPAAFGIADPRQPAGDMRHLTGVTMDQFRGAMTRYKELLGQVVATRALDKPASSSPQTAALAAEIRPLAARLREPDFRRYYEHYGAEFGRWLDS